jgi:hypothetical protein
MKSLLHNEQIQHMLKSQERRAEQDKVWIRQKQAEMLEKFIRKQPDKQNTDSADISEKK